jgi:hypothetical protein
VEDTRDIHNDAGCANRGASTCWGVPWASRAHGRWSGAEHASYEVPLYTVAAHSSSVLDAEYAVYTQLPVHAPMLRAAHASTWACVAPALAGVQVATLPSVSTSSVVPASRVPAITSQHRHQHTTNGRLGQARTIWTGTVRRASMNLCRTPHMTMRAELA